MPKTSKLSKRNLADDVAKRTNTTKTAAKRAVDEVFDALCARLLAGESIGIDGLGTFQVTERAAATRRNPQTGAPVQVSARRVVKFRPSGAIRKALIASVAAS